MITASMVKELRETTGAGMLDCKKALEETNGNMEEAITWLREKGISKAAKKASRIAAEGLAKVIANEEKAVIVEVNSETDFVAKNDEFKSLVDTIAKAILENNVSTDEEVLNLTVDGKTIQDLIIEKTATGYAIKLNGSTNDGKYISGTSGSNKLNFNATAQDNTIEYNTEKNWVKITSNTSVLTFNSASNQMRFRYFKAASYAGMQVVQLYKIGA